VFEQLTILAPGLLGASLGLAARYYALAGRVHVWARRAESRLACQEADWCDGAFADPLEAVGGSDLVVVCTPVDQIVAMTRRIAPGLRQGALVTDVGSTKSRICRLCAHAAPTGTVFVGSHPMAGSEKSGMQHARADLFRGRACLVTPLEETPAGAVEQVAGFWRALGMEVTSMSPEKHDEIVAHISHLPHKLVEAFRATLEETTQADLLLHVVDIANEDHDYYIDQVNEVLTEIGADKIPCIQVLNKIDLVDGFLPRIDRDESGNPKRVWVSAKTGAGIDLLLTAISEMLGNDVISEQLILAPDQGRLRARLYARGAVTTETLDGEGRVVLDIKLPRNDFQRLLQDDARS